MLLPDGLDCLPEAVGNFIARHCHWTPLDKEVAVAIDDSGDASLIGKRVHGTVRACDSAAGMLLVHLSERIDYEGHYTSRGVDMVVVAPAVRWHRANRLLLTWSAIRLIDAPSFALQGFGRTIGTGRLLLEKRRC